MRALYTALIALVIVTGSCTLKTSLPDLGTVPPFQLTGESGEPFRSERLAGKVWVANFVFTTCHGPCPRMSSQMRKLQGELSGVAGVHLVSFTVDPDNDTPAALTAYARQFGADPERWTFVTGDKAGLEKLSYDTFHLSRVGGPQIEHSGRFVLVDRHSRIRGYYDSSDPEAMGQLTSDIHALRKEVL